MHSFNAKFRELDEFNMSTYKLSVCMILLTTEENTILPLVSIQEKLRE